MQRPTRRSLVIANRIGIVVGALLLVAGVLRIMLLPVECLGQQMVPGQLCTDTEKGRTVTRTFDQQRSLYDATNGFLIVGGGIVAAASAIALLRISRQ